MPKPSAKLMQGVTWLHPKCAFHARRSRLVMLQPSGLSSTGLNVTVGEGQAVGLVYAL